MWVVVLLVVVGIFCWSFVLTVATVNALVALAACGSCELKATEATGFFLFRSTRTTNLHRCPAFMGQPNASKATAQSFESYGLQA